MPDLVGPAREIRDFLARSRARADPFGGLREPAHGPDDGSGKLPPSKKSKANNGGAVNGNNFDYPSDVEDMDDMKDEDGPKGKMTDEEKRKNFLERNRYEPTPVPIPSLASF